MVVSNLTLSSLLLSLHLNLNIAKKKKKPYCNAFLHSLQCESHRHLPESYCMRALGRFVVVFSSLRFAEDFALGLKSSSSSSIIMATLLCGKDENMHGSFAVFLLIFHLLCSRCFLLRLVDLRGEVSPDVLRMRASRDQTQVLLRRISPRWWLL